MIGRRTVRKCSRKASVSPYWDWIKDNGYSDEPIEANADRVSIEVTPQSEALEQALEALNRGGEGLLSERERHSFQLVIREGYSLGKAATMLSKMGYGRVSKSAVRIYTERAGKKLRKFIDSCYTNSH